MKPYYQDDFATIYHGDCVTGLSEFEPDGTLDSLLVDPPYGIDYKSNQPRREGNARSIEGDKDTSVRDEILEWWAGRGPAFVFGSWRIPRPASTRGVLVWDKGGALGMGDLSLPWKFDHEEIYVIGQGFTGRRDSGSVLRCPPVQSIGRLHPHQKPIELLSALIAKLPSRGYIFDPCMGSGSSLVAAKARGRHVVGIEKDERYCEIAAKRLAQEVLDFGGVA